MLSSRADWQTLTRRTFLQKFGQGLGAVALSALFNDRALGQDDPLRPRPCHFPAKVKNIIYLHMVGAPSHLDLFDYKPALQRYDGQPVPSDLIEGQRFAFLRGHPKLLGTRFRFKKHGRSGLELSEVLPYLSQVADDLTLIKTVHTEEFNHAPAQLFMQTGFGQFGRPSL